MSRFSSARSSGVIGAGRLRCAVFVTAFAVPWWGWLWLEVHSGGRSSLEAFVAATALSALLWWSTRLGWKLAPLVLLVPVVLGAPAWRLVQSAGVFKLSQLPQAIPVVLEDLFTPSLWLVAAPAGLALLLALLIGRSGIRLPAFVLAVSLGLLAIYLGRLLQFPVDWYSHPSLTPTTRNVASIVFLWLGVAPLAAVRLLPGLTRNAGRVRWRLGYQAAIVLAPRSCSRGLPQPAAS